VPLHHASTAHALALDKAPVAVLLAVLPANRGAQKLTAIDYAPNADDENSLGLHYSKFADTRSC